MSGAPATSPGMARLTLSGSLWMLLNSGVTRVASFAAQVALGWLLSEDDFGVFALAIGLATMTAALRDGGARQLLVRAHERYAELIGPVFWLAAAFNVLAAGVMVVIGLVGREVLGEPRLLPMLAVLAAAHVLGTPGGMYVGTLQARLRFREISVIAGVGALVRYGGTVALAWAGMGPMAFVLPMPAVALSEWVLGWWYVREHQFRRGARVREWGGMLALTGWNIAGTLGIAAINLGVNPAVKPLVALEVVGVYFFAWQIVVQIGQLISTNVNQVLVPTLARLSGEPERQRLAALRALRQLILVAALLGAGLAATYGPLEEIVWREKWAESVPAVRVLGAGYILNVLMAASLAVQIARGRFRAWALGTIVFALGLLGAAVAGAWVGGTALSIAIATSAYSAVASVIHVRWALGEMGVRTGEVLAAALPGWVIGLAAGAAALAVDAVLAGASPWVRLPLLGVVFGGVFAGLARAVLRGTLVDAAGALPPRVREVVRAMLRLHEG